MNPQNKFLKTLKNNKSAEIGAWKFNFCPFRTLSQTDQPTDRPTEDEIIGNYTKFQILACSGWVDVGVEERRDELNLGRGARVVVLEDHLALKLANIQSLLQTKKVSI